MKKIMFLCTGNMLRSQMAEGFARELGEGAVEAHSAGVSPAGIVHPKAIAVMREIGIDISGQHSKGIDPELLEEMDMVITLCGNAEANCPLAPPHIKREHWPIEDPSHMAGGPEEVMREFRRARDEIGRRVRELVDKLKKEGG